MRYLKYNTILSIKISIFGKFCSILSILFYASFRKQKEKLLKVIPYSKNDLKYFPKKDS